MKKILFCTDSESLGGAEHYLRTLLLNINQAVYDVGLVMPARDATRPLVAEVQHYDIEFYPLEGVHVHGFSWRRVVAAYRLFRRVNPDVIHFVLPSPRRCAEWIVAAALARIPRRVVTFQLVTPIPPFSKIGGFLRGLNRSIQYATLHHGIAVSQGNADLLIRQYRFPDSRLTTIYNAVDVDSFSPRNPTLAFREMWQIPAESWVITVVGRLSEQKGHQILLAALPIIWQQHPNVHVVIAGRGHLEQQLRSMALSIDANARIHFIGQQNDMPFLLANSDIFVLPSMYEGLSFAILEAMAMQCAIVASEVDGSREAITNRVHGLLVQPNNPQALAEATIWMLNNPDARMSFARAARQRIVEYFNQHSMLQQTFSLYE